MSAAVSKGLGPAIAAVGIVSTSIGLSLYASKRPNDKKPEAYYDNPIPRGSVEKKVETTGDQMKTRTSGEVSDYISSYSQGVKVKE